jgi:hypothetical protein
MLQREPVDIRHRQPWRFMEMPLHQKLYSKIVQQKFDKLIENENGKLCIYSD